MFKLEWIKPAQLRKYWPIIKEGVQIIEKSTDAWIAEDIYMAIKTGSCNLHVGTLDGKYIGFIIIQQQENYGVTSLHIWAGYSTAQKFDILELASEQFKEWGASINAEKITFSSTRPGWAKQAKKIGFEASPLITYEMKL